MPASRDFRDPVHGFVRLQGRELEIVDTPIFQRLRRIKQLALAHLVYPGAVHTRLEHTLGVVHVAGQMAERLGVHAEATRIIRLAALLHDIGHGPFSHPSEDVLAKLASEEGRQQKGETDKIHEVITRSIIRTDPDLRALISERDREDIIKLLDFAITYPDDTCRIEFPVRDFMFNPQGSLHGGIIALAMDVSMGHLLNRLQGPGATLEMKVQYLRPVRSGRAVATGRVLRRGGSVAFLESRLTGEAGELAAARTRRAGCAPVHGRGDGPPRDGRAGRAARLDDSAR